MYYIKTVYIMHGRCREQIANVKEHFTAWNTIKMFGGTCASTIDPQFCIMPTGHELLTSLLTLHTPFFSIMQITITIVCHCETVFINRFILRYSWDECLMTQVLKPLPPRGNNDGNTVVTTIHRCFPLLVHNIYSEVVMVTIQEVLLWLPAVISGLSKQHPKMVSTDDSR